MARREIAPEVFLAGLPLFKALDAATRSMTDARLTPGGLSLLARPVAAPAMSMTPTVKPRDRNWR